MTTKQTAADPATAALEKAHALARAIADSPAFREFERANKALEADAELTGRIAAFQLREQELRLSRSWGGADPEDEKALEREWQDLSSQPAFAAGIAARDALLALLRDVAGAITDGVGIDYGAACAPAGGCC